VTELEAASPAVAGAASASTAPKSKVAASLIESRLVAAAGEILRQGRYGV